MSELEKEVNNLDPDDIGLKGIFGDRFQDETTDTQKPQVVKESNTASIPSNTGNVAQKPAGRAVEATWEPVKPEPSFMDNLKDCAKWVLMFGGLNCLIFYWQQADLMASSIAVPSMCVCAALAGWGLGKNATRGNR